MIDLERMYSRLPIWLQQRVIDLEGWRINRSRYTKVFYSHLNEYKQRSSWDPIDLIRDFAKLVVVRDDVDKLVEVMIWVENNSYWEEQMPEDSRLPKLPVTVSTQRARKLAGEIRPNAKPAMPLPVSSQQWLEDLQISIEKMS